MKTNNTPNTKNTEITTAPIIVTEPAGPAPAITPEDLVKAIAPKAWYDEASDSITTTKGATINLYSTGKLMAAIGMTIDPQKNGKVEVRTYYWDNGMRDDDPEEYYGHTITPGQAAQLLTHIAQTAPACWGIDSNNDSETDDEGLKKLDRKPDGKDIPTKKVVEQASKINAIAAVMEAVTQKNDEIREAEWARKSTESELAKLLQA